MDAIDLFLFTYNCGKTNIDPETFIPKLTKALPSKISSLYVFGVEELCSILDGSAVDTSNYHFLELNKYILEALTVKYGQKDTVFHTLSIVHLGAIGLIVISPYPSLFNKKTTSKSACGYFYSSLKGAVAVRLQYKPEGSDESVELTFANAHLSAYEGEYYYQKRNYQVLKLMRSLDFNDGFGFIKPNSHSFFMGDLNYRTVKSINDEGNSEIIKKLISLQDQTLSLANPIEELVQQCDELSSGIRNDEIFMGFTEGCINFQPTYKYRVGTAIYNPKRSPSWCDRILFQSTYNIDTKGTLKSSRSTTDLPRINQYNSIKTILTSDHHPVFLSITIPFKAPESIISSSGYLKILPNDQVIDHFHRNKSVFSDTASGPTQIYMKPTKLDQVVNWYITPLADQIIHYSLWLTITSNGRLILLAIFLITGGSLVLFY